MCLIKSKFSWLIAPVLWLVGLTAIVLAWTFATPDWIMLHFDQDGMSPIELTTIGLFFAQIGLFWLVPPMQPGFKRTLFLSDFSVISFIAITRELDWHKLLVSASNLPGATTGTPFKMRFLLNDHNPLRDRIIVFLCFAVTIALCAGTLLYFLRRLLRGFFTLHPVCWSLACLGGVFIMSQFFDRLPANLRHMFDIHLPESIRALFAALEEGQELLIPIFVILATLQAHFIYNNDSSDSADLSRYREL